jgi:hypothetical protein
MSSGSDDRAKEIAGCAAQSSHDDLPLLRVHHLMAWMVATAALVSTTMWFDRTARNGPPITDPVVITALVAGAVAIAAAFTVCAFAVHWRRNGIMFPQQPGDVLLLIAMKSAFYSCGAVLGVFVVFFAIGDDDWQPIYYLLVFSIAAFSWIRMNVRGYMLFADTAPWRSVFIAAIGAPAIVLALTFMRILSTLPLIAVIASLTWAAWDDLCHVHRRWTHWLGTGVAVVLTLALIAIVGR